MRMLAVLVALAFAFVPFAHADEDTVGGKAVKAKRKAGKEIRHAGREVKAEGRKARQAVITRCADGRHTARGAAGCAAHGGVHDPK